MLLYISMAPFESFKDKALSYLAVTMIAGVGYQLNVLTQKVDKLMEVSAGTVVRIEGLEREVYKTGYAPTMPPFKLPEQVKMLDVVGIRPEQDTKIKKYITTI
jgi:uncharacterized membrane protein YoaT (DUF817 family)